MSDTRHPTGQDLMCLVCLKPAQDIDHVVNRGMGGSKERDVPENKVPLCRECHDLKTVGTIETRVAELDGRWWWYEWRRNVKDAPWITNPVEVSKRYKCLVLSDGAKEGIAPPQGAAEANTSTPALASSPSTKEESDGQTGELDAATISYRGNRKQHRSGDSLAESLPLTHEQRVAIAQAIKDTEWNRQWFAGDTGNLWIEELGESAEQYLSDFGYQPESLANILRVCAAIPSTYRNGNLRFSHHVVVYDQPPEDRMRWLTECEANEWSVAEFRRQVKGTKPRVKRWSLEELRELAYQFMLHITSANPPSPNTAGHFVDYLEEQA